MNEVAEKRDSINSQAQREFRMLLNLKAEGQLAHMTTDQVRSIVAAPEQNEAKCEPTLRDLEAEILTLESGLTALECDLAATNEVLETAIVVVKSRRGLRITARLEPLGMQDTGRLETPSKSTVPTELGRDGDESGRFG